MSSLDCAHCSSDTWERDLLLQVTGEKEHQFCRPPRATRAVGRVLGCGLGAYLVQCTAKIAHLLRLAASEIRQELNYSPPGVIDLHRSISGIFRAACAIPSDACATALASIVKRDPPGLGGYARALAGDFVARREAVKAVLDSVALVEGEVLATYFTHKGKLEAGALASARRKLEAAAREFERHADAVEGQELSVAKAFRHRMKAQWEEDREHFKEKECAVRPVQGEACRAGASPAK